MSTKLSEPHREHLLWRGESAFWHDQIREWELEIDEAVKSLSQVEQALRDHKLRLEAHAAAVRLYQLEADRHEHQLAEAGRAGAAVESTSTEAEHALESDHHMNRRRTHETLKRGHHALMARWSSFMKSLKSDD